MKNIYQIILCTAILFPFVSWAQPPNDDCGGAIEISDLEELSRALTRIGQLSNVIEARRDLQH